ncbi:MAG: hypothetical protein RLO17_15710 [Cyclobacteriaceae bacterium]
MKNIEEEIRKTMESLDSVQRADPGPYFYTRLSVRMDTRPMPLRWYWKVAAGILLVLNAGSFVILGNSGSTSNEEVLNEMSSEYLYYVPDYELTFNDDIL